MSVSGSDRQEQLPAPGPTSAFLSMGRLSSVLRPGRSLKLRQLTMYERLLPEPQMVLYLSRLPNSRTMSSLRLLVVSLRSEDGSWRPVLLKGVPDGILSYSMIGRG